MDLNLNQELSDFLDQMEHPLRKEIELLRREILSSRKGISENIKWNGPNYTFNGNKGIKMSKRKYTKELLFVI